MLRTAMAMTCRVTENDCGQSLTSERAIKGGTRAARSGACEVTDDGAP